MALMMKAGYPSCFLFKKHPVVLLGLLLPAGASRACTTFVLAGANHLYFGRNLDWF
jgi:penicillin V acylase-like amidase (Ntn superfamily)